MGRLLFLCPEKKGGKAFSPFFARREAGDLGRALARQKKSPLRLALRPLRGQGCGLLAGAPTALWKKRP